MIEIHEYSELLNVIQKYNNQQKYVFRGQAQNHPTKGYPYSFSVTFERHGCIPSAKSKWEYYCYNALKMIFGQDIYEKLPYHQMLTYVDALLQHYGWRSMQLDVSKSINAALYFAGYSYNQKDIIVSMQDYAGNPVMDVGRKAFYSENTNEFGYIFIFDKDILISNTHVNFTDLTIANIHNDCRPVRQQGCVISTFPYPIDDEIINSIHEVYKIKAELLVAYCNNHHIDQTSLFPSESEDHIYSFLLSLPRKEAVLDKGKKSGFFIKDLDIPEYGSTDIKRKSPSTAFYSSFWIFDNIGDFEKDNTGVLPKNYTYYKCQADFYHYFSKEGSYYEMPDFISLIRAKKEIILEFDNIYRHYSTSQTQYQKGIRFVLTDKVIAVYEIFVNYAGRNILGFGELIPRYYKIISDIEVVPIRIEGDCPCDDHDRHLHKLLVGKYFAQMLKEGYLSEKQEIDHVYVIS